MSERDLENLHPEQAALREELLKIGMVRGQIEEYRMARQELKSDEERVREGAVVGFRMIGRELGMRMSENKRKISELESAYPDLRAIYNRIYQVQE